MHREIFHYKNQNIKINFKIKMVRDIMKRYFSKLKKRIKEYFLMERSCGHLMETAKNFYFFSIGIDEIYGGMKNSKRFGISIFHFMNLIIFTFILILFSLSNNVYSMIKVDILPRHFRVLIMLFTLAFIWICFIKIDMILAEINFNLSPLKVFYFLINNIYSKHKLMNLNYNRLAILSRFTAIILLDYGVPITISIAMGSIVFVAILSQKIIWILLSIYFVPLHLIASIAFIFWNGINLILFSYYKLRFDQIHSSFESIVPNGFVISKRKEIQLTNLIKEHNSVSNEIKKLNLMIRKSACIAVVLNSANKNLILYLLTLHNDNIFVKLFLYCVFVVLFIMGFALTYLFSRQIKSAHQSYKLIYSILCNLKMRMKFKFKVILLLNSI